MMEDWQVRKKEAFKRLLANNKHTYDQGLHPTSQRLHPCFLWLLRRNASSRCMPSVLTLSLPAYSHKPESSSVFLVVAAADGFIQMRAISADAQLRG